MDRISHLLRHLRRGTATARGGLQRAVQRLVRPIRVSMTAPHVLDVPDVLQPRSAVLIAENLDRPQWLSLDCPCRRGHRLLINLSTAREPRWTLRQDRRNRVTLHPSVDSHSDLGRCHLWIRRGAVRWVGPSPADNRSRVSK